MVIYPPEITVTGSLTKVSTRVVMDSPVGIHTPDTLWFEIPTEYQNHILPGNMVPFVLALLFPAMCLNEPVVARGWFSESLYYSLEEIQTIFAGWFPQLQVVNIFCNQGLQAMEKSSRGGVITCFSGGVDSFYTLRRHLDHPAASYRITHALFALIGPPFHWSQPAIYQQAQQAFQPMMADLQVTLLTLRSNVFDFCHPLGLSWPMVHGLITAAAIHLFGTRFSKVFIPSSYYYKRLFPWGSHPHTDPLLSTESTPLIHHGSHLTRTAKTAAIADWSPAQKHLNVCLTRPDPVMNCGHCSKCLRTLLTLTCTPWLDKFRTFPLRGDQHGQRILEITEQDLNQMIRDDHDVAFFEEVLAFARERDHAQIAGFLAGILEKRE